MKPETKAYIFREGGKIVGDLIRVGMARPKKPSASPEAEKEASLAEKATVIPQTGKEAPEISSQAETKSPVEKIAPAKSEEECPTCAPLTDLQQFLERRKVERALSDLEAGEANEGKRKSLKTVRKYIEGEDIA